MTAESIFIDGEEVRLGYRIGDERMAALRAHSTPFAMTAAMAAQKLLTFDPTDVLRLQFQGSQGSCAGHAMAHLCQWMQWLETKRIVMISRKFCYITGQEHDRAANGDHGATIAGVVAAAMQDGVCREEDCPYPQDFHYDNHLPDEARRIAALHKVLKSLSVLDTFEQEQAWLGNLVGGVDIGIDWTQGLANFRGQCIEMQHVNDGYSLGGHSLALICLADKTDANGDHYAWMANSHGPNWGYKGWAMVAPAVRRYWLRQKYGFAGVSNLERFRRQSFDYVAAV